MILNVIPVYRRPRHRAVTSAPPPPPSRQSWKLKESDSKHPCSPSPFNGPVPSLT